LKSIFWLGPYLTGLFLISYTGSFGGKGYIPFGWDFLVIAIFTVVIAKLAIATRQGANLPQYQIYCSESG
jgi:hypothetical protein